MKIQEKGSTLVFGIIMAAVLGITVLAIARSINFNAHQGAYFDSLEGAHKLAETGLNDAIAKLLKNPNMSEFSSTLTNDPTNKGNFINQIQARDVLVGPSKQRMYYIVTKAKTNSAKFSTELHSYVKVSNVGDYFLAVKEKLTVSDGVNSPDGKIYAPQLEFKWDGVAPHTSLLCAEYSDETAGALTPPLTAGSWPSGVLSDVLISNSCTPNNVPLKRAPLLFPQVFASDLSYWKTKAAGHVLVKKSFGKVGAVTQVYPPGYNTSKPGDDEYVIPDSLVGHTNINAHHIYYSDDNIELTNVNIHGQVLFIAAGNILINGNITVDPGTTYPGTGADASVANQVVLIAQGSVIIKPFPEQFPRVPTDADWDAMAPVTQTIQACIIAPNSKLVAQNYGAVGRNYTPTGEAYRRKLKLDFKGSIITSGLGDAPDNIGDVFAAGRTFAYDPSFKTTPPPFLPAVSEIYYVFENYEAQGLY